MQHASLAAGGWAKLTLIEQLGNVGSEIGRAARWKDKNPKLSDQAVVRALELLDLTLADTRWNGRLKEIARAREMVCDAWFGGKEFGNDLAGLERYFFHFAVAARK